MNDFLVTTIYIFIGFIVLALVAHMVATVATEAVVKVLKEHGR
jgi:hypothetical protein